jgi:hypothetical protein
MFTLLEYSQLSMEKEGQWQCADLQEKHIFFCIMSISIPVLGWFESG